MFSEKIMIQEAEKCSRCGVCAAVCPVFRELQRETYSSRGKTEIAKALVAGELPYSSYTEDIFIEMSPLPDLQRSLSGGRGPGKTDPRNPR